MVSFKSSLIVAAVLVVGALAVPTNATEGLAILQGRAVTPSATGISNGYYYSWWTDNTGRATYTNGAAGQYIIDWNGNGELVGGKGWNPGSSNRQINYSGTYLPEGNSYLAIYGWTRNPLIEYFILESYSNYNPASEAEHVGTVKCDGANYDILQATRINQPSIDGTQTYQRFWSVRNPVRRFGGQISGSVNVACHFNAWSSHGMDLGSHNYQIVATEGFYGTGSASITVS